MRRVIRANGERIERHGRPVAVDHVDREEGNSGEEEEGATGR